MITGDLKKWISVGTGVGIEVRGDDLVITVAKVRPQQIRVIAATRIRGVHVRPAAEWGREYNGFLKAAGCAHLAATLLLPREEVIVRQLSLPGVAPKDLDAAVRYQVDTLHPFAEDDVGHGWARIPNSSVVLIGIAKKEVIDHYTTLLAEAGVRIASFTFSVAVVYSAIRLLASPPEGGFLIAGNEGEDWEIYGESPARPIFSAVFDAPLPRAVALAAAELRLEPEPEPMDLSDLLPNPVSAPEGWDADTDHLSYATALASACRWLAITANLLPRQFRSRNSRTVYVPTAVLAAALLVMLVVLGAYGGMKEHDYLAALNKEIGSYTAEASKVSGIDKQMDQMITRRQQIRQFRLRTRQDLDALQELSRLLSPPAWVRDLQITRSQVTMTGQSPAAAGLLERIDGSPMFQHSEFTSPISGGDMQNFSIRIERAAAAAPKQGEGK